MTPTHPLMRALLVRVAYADDCPPAEADRILRLYFPKLDQKETLAALADAKEAHDARNSLLAEQTIQKLIHAQTKEEIACLIDSPKLTPAPGWHGSGLTGGR